MKEKSKVFKIFQRFKAAVQKESGHELKTLKK